MSERVTETIGAEAREVIEAARMFFLATCDDRGLPTCSYKGGDPGFVRVVDDRTLAFPNYDGNGKYQSMGNLLRNPNVGCCSWISRANSGCVFKGWLGSRKTTPL